MLSADVWGVERSHAAVEPPANFALRGLASPRTRRVESKRPPTRDGLSTPVGPAGMHLSAPTPPKRKDKGWYAEEAQDEP